MARKDLFEGGTREIGKAEQIAQGNVRKNAMEYKICDTGSGGGDYEGYMVNNKEITRKLKKVQTSFHNCFTQSSIMHPKKNVNGIYHDTYENNCAETKSNRLSIILSFREMSQKMRMW